MLSYTNCQTDLEANSCEKLSKASVWSLAFSGTGKMIKEMEKYAFQSSAKVHYKYSLKCIVYIQYIECITVLLYIECITVLLLDNLLYKTSGTR